MPRVRRSRSLTGLMKHVIADYLRHVCGGHRPKMHIGARRPHAYLRQGQNGWISTAGLDGFS